MRILKHQSVNLGVGSSMESFTCPSRIYHQPMQEELHWQGGDIKAQALSLPCHLGNGRQQVPTPFISLVMAFLRKKPDERGGEVEPRLSFSAAYTHLYQLPQVAGGARSAGCWYLQSGHFRHMTFQITHYCGCTHIVRGKKTSRRPPLCLVERRILHQGL